MTQIIESHDSVAVTASSHTDCSDAQVLKRDNTFLLVNKLGEVASSVPSGLGLYHKGTRYLSQWELLVCGTQPKLLNSTLQEDNSFLHVQLTTADITDRHGTVLPHGTLHLFRSLILLDATLFEKLVITNYHRHTAAIEIEYRFSADYVDIFEIRGAKRKRRGELLNAETDKHHVTLGYRGLDHRSRWTTIEFTGQATLDDLACSLPIHLAPGASVTIESAIRCGEDQPVAVHTSHRDAIDRFVQRTHDRQSTRTTVVTSNERFNQWINRSLADLQMLVCDTAIGEFPYAGVPWFATPFGRDAIVTALETCWLQPQLARDTLRFLAHTQAEEIDASAAAEPGKIIHEMRDGEMAELGEIPFRRYYGTVDATPLFLILAGKYFRRSGDLDFIRSIWPNIRAALRWIDQYGDCDGDGFVEYCSHGDGGLVHQCWKDSNDSIFHADGSDPPGALAVCEVQGYVYQAKLLCAEMATMLGETALAMQLVHQAANLKANFNEQFWSPAINNFAIALDGNKRRCEVRSSNVGHLLYTDIVSSEHVQTVCDSLTSEQAFNGWGVRTIFEGEARYNPMSYHNGSVWPHDTAICCAGLARQGHKQQAMPLAEGLFNASLFNEWHRLPELFCGFPRLLGHGPTLYPVACSPQAWAAGAVFLLLKSMLGLSFAPTKPQIRFDNPQLPHFIDWVAIRNLRLADGSVDLVLRRHPRDVGLTVERKEGDIELIVMA